MAQMLLSTSTANNQSWASSLRVKGLGCNRSISKRMWHHFGDSLCYQRNNSTTRIIAPLGIGLIVMYFGMVPKKHP